MSAFALEDGIVCHTYSTYARGLDGLWGMYQWLDRATRGATRRGSSGGTATKSTTSAERRRGCRGVATDSRPRIPPGRSLCSFGSPLNA